MGDVGIMRSLLTSSNIKALGQVEGKPDGTIGILPMPEQRRLLVLALGEEASEYDLQNVVSGCLPLFILTHPK